ncbi:hypothetical protein [Streptomyces taklimakanensis]|uniref:hypothetical protein n=1 Tax=Streptomyces taklimakanensis TaxID=2569853 RepID=UPI00192E5646|nr:hypothetical protein [Streptomyces taklimakanensis]
MALAGTRTDTLRVALTAFGVLLAALAVFSALNVLAIEAPAGLGPEDGSASWSDRYTNALLREPGLRPGVATALLMLGIPVLALAGQCARLGAPARDRRLAAIRLAGATPRQTTAVAAAETAVASLLGTLGGLVVYLIGHEVLHRPDAEGRLRLPTDVLPSAPAMAATVLGLPLLAAATAAVMLRRVTVDPLGVVRRTRSKGTPKPWPAVPLVLGVGAFFAYEGLWTWYDETRDPSFAFPLPLVLLFGGGLLAALGIVLGTGWISHTTGRVLHRLARRPAPLLAARRLLADPWHGSRTLAALLVAVVFGAGALAVRSYFTVMDEARREAWRLQAEAAGETGAVGYGADSFYLRSMDLVDTAVIVALVIAAGGMLVAVAEAVVARRRAHAALTASGVPRPVLVPGAAVADAHAPGPGRAVGHDRGHPDGPGLLRPAGGGARWLGRDLRRGAGRLFRPRRLRGTRPRHRGARRRARRPRAPGRPGPPRSGGAGPRRGRHRPRPAVPAHRHVGGGAAHRVTAGRRGVARCDAVSGPSRGPDRMGG